MTDKPTPTDAELKAMWQLHAADIGGIFCYARAVLAKWGQPAQAEEPVAWLRNTTDQIADYVADNWPMRKYDLSEIEQRLRMLASAPSGPARVPLTDGRIQDLLLCGNPTDEEMRLIRIGWDAARGIKGGQHG